MSANNYTICPKCLENVNKERARKIKELNESYGRISKEKYEKLLDSANTPIYLKPSLREDYEVGIKDGIFRINYSASCRNCGFMYRFSEQQTVYFDRS